MMDENLTPIRRGAKLVELWATTLVCIAALYAVFQKSAAMVWWFEESRLGILTFAMSIGFALFFDRLKTTKDQHGVRNDGDNTQHSKQMSVTRRVLAFTQFCFAIWLCRDLSQFSWIVAVGTVAVLTAVGFGIREPAFSSRIFTVSCFVSFVFVCARGIAN